MNMSLWNESTAKSQIIDFLDKSSDSSDKDYIPPSDRIAAFDNDGTLWVEQPAPAQTDLILKKLVERVKADPTLASKDPFKGIVNKDPVFLGALAKQEPSAVITFLSGIGEAWEGVTPEEYDKEVRDFLSTTMHPKFDCPWTELVYQPMLELFDLLSEYEWRVFVCSGGGRDFMRVFSEEVLGVSKENIIGSAPEFEYIDGKLIRQNKLHGNLSLGGGKLEQIYSQTGRTALFVAGNADVDLEMLEAAKFRVLIVHDDDHREFNVTSGAEKVLSKGKKDGWTMVSMKNDWKSIFKD